MNPEADSDSSMPAESVPFFHRRIWRNYRSASGLNYWILRSVTRPGWLVLGGIGAAALMGVDTNLSVAYQAFVFLTLLFAWSAVSSRFRNVKFSVNRRLPRFGTVGQPLRYEVTVRNGQGNHQHGLSLMEDLPDPRPELVEFSTTPEPGEERRNWFDRKFLVYRWRWLIAQNRQATSREQRIPTLAPNSSCGVTMELVPTRRGVIRLPGLTIACPDPFGLFRKLVSLPEPDAMLVLPKRYAVRTMALSGSKKHQPGGVTLAASVGESEEFISLREYRPGDPLRKIHWKSSARSGRPIVKEFVDEYFMRHGLVLDTFAESDGDPEFEEAVSMAASFACTLQNQDSLLDLMFIGAQAYTFTMGRGVGHVEKILEVLAGVKPCRRHDFKSLHRLIGLHAVELSGCLCVLLAWDEPRRTLIRLLRQLNVPVTVMVIRPPGADTDVDPGPMADEPDRLHLMETGKVKEALARM